MLTADQTASVIIARTGSWIDAVSLQKLLYYVQAWHLAITGEPLFPEKIKAWKDGPVVPQVWHLRKGQATRSASEQDVDGIQLDGMTDALIDLVLATYGSMSGDELSALTHVEEPWCEARGDLPPDAQCQNPIDPGSMARFYRARRRLGGRTAADLAAGGIHLQAHDPRAAVDVDAILDSIGDLDSQAGDDPWGGANLHSGSQYDTAGIEQARRRAHAGA